MAKKPYVFADIGTGEGQLCRCGREIKALQKVAHQGNKKWVHLRCQELQNKKGQTTQRTREKQSQPRAPRQSPLGPQEYKRYIQSKAWGSRRASYFSRNAKKCVVCLTDQDIHLHHLTYERLGCELDSDLRPLCELHHSLAHQHHAIYGGTLYDATLAYIKRASAVFR